MALGCLLLLGLMFVGHASHGDVVGVVNSTALVIGRLQDTGSRAEDLVAQMSRLEAHLDELGTRAEADFDAPLYARKGQRFSELARLASSKAEQSLAKTNATTAGELNEKAVGALRNMTRVDDDLNAMERDLHEKLHSALAAALNTMVRPGLALEEKADHQQEEAHSMMDPLYSWGDRAEDRADALNDQADDALSITDKALRMYIRHIVRHAGEVQRGVERRLFSGTDRASTWLEVRGQVNAAARHAQALQASGVLRQEAVQEAAQQQVRMRAAQQKADESMKVQKAAEVTLAPAETTTTTAYNPFILDPLVLLGDSYDMPIRPSLALVAVALLASGGALAVRRSRRRAQAFGVAQSPLLA